MAAIRKILLWRTRSPLLDRWDGELTYEDGTKQRYVTLTQADAIGFIQRALPTTLSVGAQVEKHFTGLGLPMGSERRPAKGRRGAKPGVRRRKT